MLAADGTAVEAGQAVVAIEAMKMEHRVLAPFAGSVRLAVANGEQVARDQQLARVDPHEAPDPETPVPTKDGPTARRETQGAAR